MEPLQPEQAKCLLDTNLSFLKREHPVTRKVIAAIPADRGDYRPNPVAKTAMELAWHIASAENRFLDAVVSGVFNFGGSGKPENVQTPADVSRWYEEEFTKNIARLEQLSGEQLAKPIDFRGVLNLPAVMYLHIGLSHTIHHRGQLSVYLRPMGAKVPSIYGESYDDAEARKAAQAN